MLLQCLSVKLPPAPFGAFHEVALRLRQRFLDILLLDGFLVVAEDRPFRLLVRDGLGFRLFHHWLGLSFFLGLLGDEDPLEGGPHSTAVTRVLAFFLSLGRVVIEHQPQPLTAATLILGLIYLSGYLLSS